MTTFRFPSDILITSWLFTARCSTWPGNHLVPCVAELVRSCIPIHAHLCLPDPKCLFIHLVCRCALCRPLLPCHSEWRGSLPRHGLWWLTCELHCSPLPRRLGSVYQLWKSPLLCCVPWSSDRTSCLSLQRMSWSSSCKAHDRSIRSSLHPTNWATHGTRWFPGHMLHRAVNNQDVIKMSNGHRNVVIR